jgi:opacity protein-like surface antigen
MLQMERVGILAGACFAIAIASAASARAAADPDDADASRDAPRDGSGDVHGKPAEPPSSARLGFQGGVRIAYTDGIGIVYHGVKLSDASSGALPLIVDLGWRLLPQLYVGVYGQYAPVFLKHYALTCPDGLSCSAQDWRVGLEGDFHFMPSSRLDPYVGLGFGYEVLHTTLHGNQIVQQSDGTFVAAVLDERIVDRGWEFASLTAGVDWRFNDIFGAGLFVVGTIGEYDVQTGTATATTATQQETGVLPPLEKVVHGLVFVGARGTFNL